MILRSNIKNYVKASIELKSYKIIIYNTNIRYINNLGI